MFSWPILRAAHTSKVHGDEEVAVSSIVFSTDGSLFAITCKSMITSLVRSSLISCIWVLTTKKLIRSR